MQSNVHALTRQGGTVASNSPDLCPGVIVQFQVDSGNVHNLGFTFSQNVRRLGILFNQVSPTCWDVLDVNNFLGRISIQQILYVIGDPSKNIEIIGPLYDLERYCWTQAELNAPYMKLSWMLYAKRNKQSYQEPVHLDKICSSVFHRNGLREKFSTFILLSFNDRLFQRVPNADYCCLQYIPEIYSDEIMTNLYNEAKELKDGIHNNLKAAAKNSFRLGNVNHLFQELGQHNFEFVIDTIKKMGLELDDCEKPPILPSKALKKVSFRTQNDIRSILNAAGVTADGYGAFSVLKIWKIFFEHNNLALVRMGLPLDNSFLPHVENKVLEIIYRPPMDTYAHLRVNRTQKNINSFAIDSQGTREIDDAVAWDHETRRILVHIADVTRYFPQGLSHPLVQTALERVQTICVKSDRITMFPPKFSEDVLSLGANDTTCVLTFSFKIFEDGRLCEDSFLIEPSYIRPPVKLTYMEVDNAILNKNAKYHSELKTIHKYAEKRKVWRELMAQAPEKSDSGTNTRSKTRRLENEKSFKKAYQREESQIIVEEMMITTNTIAGLYSHLMNIPMPFRGQEEDSDTCNDTVSASNVSTTSMVSSTGFRRCLPPVKVKSTAFKHLSLGVNQYVSVTSPIRKFEDLVSQFQIKASLMNQVLPVSKEQMDRVIVHTTTFSENLKNVEKRTKKYWIFEDLRKRGNQVIYKGFVRSVESSTIKSKRRGQIYLKDHGVHLMTNIPDTIHPNMAVKVRIKEIIPRTSYVNSIVSIDEEFSENRNNNMRNKQQSISSQWSSRSRVMCQSSRADALKD